MATGDGLEMRCDKLNVLLIRLSIKDNIPRRYILELILGMI